MTEPKSSFPVSALGDAGRAATSHDEAATPPRQGLRDLLLGLGMLALMLSVLAILGRVAEPLNFALAGAVVAIVGAAWLLMGRTGR
jgi:lysozyme family protein